MKAIDIDDVKRTYCRGRCTAPFCMDDDYYEGMICAELDTFLKKFKQEEIIEVIPMSYIIDRIRGTSGAESAYLNRLVNRYREEQGSNALS